ncbi:Protein-lysine methyltransferase METTL21D [Toxocara canis]|uniref:Protein-lysine methyltransferase METTL21D n=1 Tax=Toxocara canis TaxID=6265 RepID=A0A0B2VSZ9_TOXCA|nr:Protein-lysine methyltransferase METTL21D [Toxocara canis]
MCDSDDPSKGCQYFVREMEFDGRNLKIHQECESDVGGVVWDSAIVACYYFLRNKHYWKRKEVLELGAGTGVCSIVLAMLGAYVKATDLPERLPLLRFNVTSNEEEVKVGGGAIEVESLDWNRTVSSVSSFDVILLIDLLYYVKGVESLVRTLRSLRAAELLCIYEERDIGEAHLAQKRFFELVSPYFDIVAVPTAELDPLFSDPAIFVFRLMHKEILSFKLVCIVYLTKWINLRRIMKWFRRC